MDLYFEFVEIANAFEERRIEYALCGGLAMAVYAFPRTTMDIDFLVLQEDVEKAKATLSDLGFSLDSGLLMFEAHDILIHRVVKPLVGSNEVLPVDLIVAKGALGSIWEERKTISWEGGELSVVSVRGLIEMKKMRDNGQDQEDILKLQELLDAS